MDCISPVLYSAGLSNTEWKIGIWLTEGRGCWRMLCGFGLLIWHPTRQTEITWQILNRKPISGRNSASGFRSYVLTLRIYSHVCSVSQRFLSQVRRILTFYSLTAIKLYFVMTLLTYNLIQSLVWGEFLLAIIVLGQSRFSPKFL